MFTFDIKIFLVLSLRLLLFWKSNTIEKIESPTPYVRHFEPNSNGNQPPNLNGILANLEYVNSWSTIRNAYWHMLNLRNSQPFEAWGGSIFDFPSQWQTYFWYTSMKYIENQNMNICEIGIGPGYSALNFLVATTSGPWTEGAKLFQFDIGFKHSYKKRKKIALEYFNKYFNGRIFQYWGDSSKVVKKFARNNTEFICDIVHIDGAHTLNGLMEDIQAMKLLVRNNSIVFIDDYQLHPLRTAISALTYFEIDEIYKEKALKHSDWMAQSVYLEKPEPDEKVYVRGHYKI